ncbi:MAG: RagB/SusD family nutrient uptake outer membrane protein [Bacteroidales bacterium]|nr:RagB/SusD family nutrient uptake outer membrane protein [Bacteroidales bacterium]
MKKLTYTAAAAIIILSSLVSCEDYLNVKPRGYDIASTTEHYAGLLYGSEKYFLKESFPYMCFETSSSAEGIEMAYSQIGSYVTDAFKWEADIYREDQICGEWNSFTTILYGANKVIAEVLDASNGTEAERLALHSEARMLRAWCLFMMSQFFGEIPLITEATTDRMDLPLSTVEEVREFVVAEMGEAVVSLADEAEHHLRIFKGSGYGLYGKVLFQMGRYEEAAAQFATALKCLNESSPAIGLMDYNTMVTESKDLNYVTNSNLNPELLYAFIGMPRLWEAVYAGLYGQLLFGVKNEILELYFYDRADTRLTMYSSISTGNSAYKTYSKSHKYAANINCGNISTNYALDLADIYVEYAECLARSGNLDKAAELLVELRRHRMEPGHEAIPADVSTKDDMIRFAFEEGMRERLGFGTSWFEMKRLWNDPLFQDLKQYYVHTVGNETYRLTEDRLYMKIPPTVIAWHPEYSK